MTTLNCEQAAELFSPQIDGFISTRERTILREHLAQCRHCADEFAEWQRISAAIRQIPGEACPAPDFSRNVINSIVEIEQQRKVPGKINTWKKQIAAVAAAALIMAGSFGLNYAMQGHQVAVEPVDPGQGTSMMANNETNNRDEEPVIKTDTGAAITEKEDSQTEPVKTSDTVETENKPSNNNDSKPEQPVNNGQNQPLGSNAGSSITNPTVKHEPQAVLLSNNMVIKSTVLKLVVNDTGLTMERTVEMAAAAGGKAVSLGEQNTGNGIVHLLRITVPKDAAPNLVNSLAPLGTIFNRNDENRNITSQYNNLAARYNEMVESKPEDTETTAEMESMKQQLNQWSEDAQGYTIILWLQQK